MDVYRSGNRDEYQKCDEFDANILKSRIIDGLFWGHMNNYMGRAISVINIALK